MTLASSCSPASVATLSATGPKYEHVTFWSDLSRAVGAGDAVAGATFIRATERRADPAAGSRVIAAIRCSGTRSRNSARAGCGHRRGRNVSRCCPIAEIDGGGAARIVALVDVPVG